MVFGGVAIGEIQYAEDVSTDPHYAFAGGTVDVHRYDRDTDAWTTMTPDPTKFIWNAMAVTSGHLWVASLSAVSLWYSADYGDTWTAVIRPGASGTVDALTISGATTLVMCLNGCSSSADNGVYTRPVDNSGAWTQIVASGTNFVHNAEIRGSRLWYAINSGTIRHFHVRTPATLGGTDTDVVTGFSSTVAVIRGEPSSDTTAYATDGLFAGITPAMWRINGTTPTAITPSTTVATGAVDLGSNGSGVLLVRWVGAAGADVIYRSITGGGSWATVKSGSVTNGQYPAVGWSAGLDYVAMVLWGPGLAVSVDAGLTWSDTPSSGESLQSLAVL